MLMQTADGFRPGFIHYPGRCSLPNSGCSQWRNVRAVGLLVVAACAQGDATVQPADPAVDKVTVPQNDLHVSVDGFRIVPPMGLGSWAAFATVADTTTVMGDVVVQEAEIGPVERAVVEHGLTVTGLHNHFVRATPPVMFMHIGGRGRETSVRAAVDSIFSTVATLRGGDPASAPAPSVQSTLDTALIAETLGFPGSSSGGVFKITIGRPDVTVTHDGVRVTTDMGLNTWASWQGTMDRAAVAGDFVMLGDEVAPVIESLVADGIEVVAVHNHMVGESPRTFFLHYWGVGRVDALARSLREALELTGAVR